MQFGLSLPPFGEHADPRLVRSLAVDAEAAGWDGFFLWDHMVFRKAPLAVADPWIALAAVAGATERIRIGTMVTPLSRRRPWVVARQVLGLDHLSEGRFILGVGLGAPVHQDFTSFGEATDDRVRAAMLDESLALLERFMSGKKVRHAGTHYQVKDVTFLPPPVRSRVPIWVGGYWPAKGPMRRAARFDGVAPGRQGGPLRPRDLPQIQDFIDRHRDPSEPFDYVVSGATEGDGSPDDAGVLAPWRQVGATWWIEDLSPWRFGMGITGDAWPTDEIVRRVRGGPPRP